MADKKYTYAVGKRKTAVAQVRLYAGKGESFVNGVPFRSYIKRPDLFSVLLAPFKTIGKQDAYYFEIKVEGSGESAQAQAIRHAISRALVQIEPDFRKLLKDATFLTRDSRMVERKKPGLHKARKASQWSKR